MTKQALGRGLSALFKDNQEANNNEDYQVTFLNIKSLEPGKFQPRIIFNEEKINELASSIRDNGVLQPIVVRKIEQDKYQIIAGERRWRASKKIGLDTIPAIIRDIDDKTSMEAALAENIQRQSLTAIEEGEGYKRLIEEFKCTQEELASALGKSRSHITNMLRLLNLSDKIKDFINQGMISSGHAKILIGNKDAEKIAKKIVNDNLSIRDTEKLINRDKAKKDIIAPKKILNDSDIAALGNSLSKQTGLNVKIKSNKSGGNVVLNYKDLQELDLICQIFTKFK